MSSGMNLRTLLEQSTSCVMAPCIYDAASAKAAELAGYEAMMFSGGEFSAASTGLIDYGFNNLSDLEWIVSRVAASSPLPLAVDIEGGFGGPIPVYRTVKRLARIGASAVQLEDGADAEKTGGVLSRADYAAKVKAAVAAAEGTDCMVIARTNVDPDEDLAEAIARCQEAIDLGADMTTVVRLSRLDQAERVAAEVPGWKMYPDAGAPNGVPEITLAQLDELGFNFLTVHFMLKAAMEGMIEHGLENRRRGDVAYTVQHHAATGIAWESASPLFDPNGMTELEGRFTGAARRYNLNAHDMPDFPAHLPHTPVEVRF